MLLESEITTGWDLAYRTQLGAHGGKSSDYLWTEEPVPILQDADLFRLLRKRCAGMILDAGCGDGRNALYLERHGLYVVGVDISPAAIKIAASRALEAAQNRVIFLQDDIRNLRVCGPVDGVICIGTLSHMYEPKRCLTEFFRVLRPGGLLICNLYTPEDQTYGNGCQIDIRTFEYKGTLFRYYLEHEALDLVQGWQGVQIRSAVWMEPPHDEFRPLPHTHVCWVVTATKPE
jgi:SAM-dependent methyltransferase